MPVPTFLRILRASLASQLSSIVLSLKTIFHNHPTQMDAPFFYPLLPQSIPVQVWSDTVLNMENLDVARSAMVLDISHLKATSKMRHEQLDVRVRVPGIHGGIYRMKIDRDRAPSGSSSALNLLQDGPRVESHLSSTYANDCVHIPRGGDAAHFRADLCKDTETCCRLTLPLDNPLPLADFVVLFPTVTQYAPEYDPTRRQCYWYASVIYKVVHAKYSKSEEKFGVAAEKRGRFIGNTDSLAPVTDAEVTEILMRWNTAITAVGLKKSISSFAQAVESGKQTQIDQLQARIHELEGLLLP